jgi:hypothetical protein
MAPIRAKLGHLTELDMSRLSSYDTTATSLVIASNVQKWYTLTGIQSSIFVARWRVTAPNRLLATLDNRGNLVNNAREVSTVIKERGAQWDFSADWFVTRKTMN